MIACSESVSSCLNPCFSGCWSRTEEAVAEGPEVAVLILVLVDVGLGHLSPAKSTFMAR